MKGDGALEGAVPHGQHYVVHLGPLEDVVDLQFGECLQNDAHALKQLTNVFNW